jgi:hypothetical protein
METYNSFKTRIDLNAFKENYASTSIKDLTYLYNTNDHKIKKLAIELGLSSKNLNYQTCYNNLDIEKFKQDYNILSWNNLCKKYHITQRILRTLVKNLNLYKKSSIQTFVSSINKYDFINYYCSHSFKETRDYYHLDNTKTVYLIDLFKINKTNEEKYNNKLHTLLLKYGVSNKFRLKYSKLFLSLVDSKDKSLLWLQQHNQQYSFWELLNLFHCSPTTLKNWIINNKLREYIKDDQSHFENEIQQYIATIVNTPVEVHNRKILDSGQEIDIYYPQYKIGIEFNGNYWHSSIFKTMYYHQNKSKLAESKGIRLIHIYEYEWLNNSDKLKSMLRIAFSKYVSKIYARQCLIKLITNEEAKPFNDANHLQGHRNAQVTYGLFYKDRLVQLMSFSKTKWNRNLKGDNAWEIIRGCPSSNNVVVGGVSKLFSHFVKDYNPSSVFSYCDFNKFNGMGYEKIGMKFIGYTKPDMKWLMSNNVVINRQPSKHAELKNQARAKIYGAGSKKYLWIA